MFTAATGLIRERGNLVNIRGWSLLVSSSREHYILSPKIILSHERLAITPSKQRENGSVTTHSLGARQKLLCSSDVFF